jgi:ribosome-binding factor A
MPANPSVKRAVRVAERIKTELSSLLLRGAVHDPRAEGAIVTDVKVSDDLGHARVYVRLLVDADEKRQKALVRALSSAAGFLRREIGKTLETKKTPDLVFFWDEGMEHALRVESILNDLRREGELEGGEGKKGGK